MQFPSVMEAAFFLMTHGYRSVGHRLFTDGNETVFIRNDGTITTLEKSDERD